MTGPTPSFGSFGDVTEHPAETRSGVNSKILRFVAIHPVIPTLPRFSSQRAVGPNSLTWSRGARLDERRARMLDQTHRLDGRLMHVGRGFVAGVDSQRRHAGGAGSGRLDHSRQ